MSSLYQFNVQLLAGSYLTIGVSILHQRPHCNPRQCAAHGGNVNFNADGQF